MMAADGWGDAQAIYDYLRTPIGSGGGGLDPTKGGFQAQAIRAMIANPGEFQSDPDEFLFEEGLGYTGAVPNAKALIDNLLSIKTATELPGDVLGEGPDDPVGLGIYNDGDINGDLKLAHAITVWSDGPNGLTVTDSDDSTDGTVVLPWLPNGEINYHGTHVYVGYVSFMADSPVPEPTAVVSIVGMAGIGLIGLVCSRARRA